MKNIFVSQPGLQHAHQLAWALYERGLLQAFWSGVPVISSGGELSRWHPKSRVKKVKWVPIPPEYRHHPIIFPALMWTGTKLPCSIIPDDFGHRVCHWFDWWISRHIERLNPKVVIAYENSAYHTFLAAKRIGAKCVLDAASLHYSVGRQLQVDRMTSYSHEVDRRKELEIDLADLILTCSPLASDSYLAAGVPSSKLQPVMLGANLPEGIAQGWKAHNRPLRFMFAGALRYLKAIDVILAVFRRLHAEQLPAEIVFVGGLAEPGWLEEINKTPNAQYHPGVAQTELYRLLGEADCLLLPSRFDSFGMVVAEAMACGTPAIVSSMTGAKAMIEQFPGCGWIVESEVESLYRCIRDRIENRDELFAARHHALEAAQHFTWQAYRRRVGQILQEFVGQ